MMDIDHAMIDDWNTIDLKLQTAIYRWKGASDALDNLTDAGASHELNLEAEQLYKQRGRELRDMLYRILSSEFDDTLPKTGDPHLDDSMVDATYEVVRNVLQWIYDGLEADILRQSGITPTQP